MKDRQAHHHFSNDQVEFRRVLVPTMGPFPSGVMGGKERMSHPKSCDQLELVDSLGFRNRIFFPVLADTNMGFGWSFGV